LALLAEYDACDPGKKGEFARRNGIYSSQLNRPGFPGDFDLRWVLLPNSDLKSGAINHVSFIRSNTTENTTHHNYWELPNRPERTTIPYEQRATTTIPTHQNRYQSTLNQALRI